MAIEVINIHSDWYQNDKIREIATTVNQLVDAVSTESVKSLPLTSVDGQQYNVVGFYTGFTIGGGAFVWRASQSKSTHNGVTVYAPEAIAAWNGTQAGIATLLNWSGGGSGVFVRVGVSAVTPELAGAVANSGMDCTTPIQKAVDYLGSIGGGKLHISGTYDITAPINMSGQSVIIEGGSRFTSLFRQNTLNTKILNITGNFCGAKSMSFIYGGLPMSARRRYMLHRLM